MNNNNYKILILNNDISKKLRLENNLNYLKYNSRSIQNINSSYVKLCFLLLLMILIGFHNSKSKKLNLVKENKIELDQHQKKISNILEQKKFWNTTFLKNEMHSYGLYNFFKFPFISLILMLNMNSQENIIPISKLIKNITKDNSINIEIILYFQKGESKGYNMIKRECKHLIKSNILKIYYEKNNIANVYSSLVNMVKGLYIIFINNLALLKNLNIEYFYNFVKGKVDNYFNLSISPKSLVYLIKARCLKNLIDNGIQFDSFEMIITTIKSIPSPNLNYIHISLCPNDEYTNLAYVSISSILNSKSSNTFICFYLIIPSDFDKKNMNFLDSLHEEYEYFNITFITMDKRYNNSYTDHRITEQAYYRFSLGELLPNVNKCIYLDTDIIAYKDLSNFFNLNFNGKIILGYPSYGNKNRQRYGYHRINTGILLLNLNEMRRNHFEKQVMKIIKKGRKFKYHDQTLLNDYFKEYLGIFPPEYHTRPWSNYKEMEIFNKIIGKPFDSDYFYFAHKYPTIRHFLGSYKPRNFNINYIEDWWFYARKSKYYNSKSTTFQSAFSF